MNILSRQKSPRIASLQIAALQLKPRLGDIEHNLRKALAMLAGLEMKPTFLVLPELAFTGYNFHSPDHIRPFLEPFHESLPKARNGILDKCPLVNWAIETATNYKCFTLVGYPELFQDKIFNSAILVSPVGTILFNYRKSFMYEADEAWGCEENPVGFQHFPLCLDPEYHQKRKDSGVFAEDCVLDQKNQSPVKKADGMALEAPEIRVHIDPQYKESFVTAAIGICMDLSNYEFRTPFEKFEFASYCYAHDVDLILVPMAWLSSRAPKLVSCDKEAAIKRFNQVFKEDQPPVYNVSKDSDEAIRRINTNKQYYDGDCVDLLAVDYWILRMLPLFNGLVQKEHGFPANNKLRTVVLCNRTGIEDDVVYAGCSSILQFGTLDPSTLSSESSKEEIELLLMRFLTLGSSNPSVAVYRSLPLGREGIAFSEVDLSGFQG